MFSGWTGLFSPCPALVPGESITGLCGGGANGIWPIGLNMLWLLSPFNHAHYSDLPRLCSSIGIHSSKSQKNSHSIVKRDSRVMERELLAVCTYSPGPVSVECSPPQSGILDSTTPIRHLVHFSLLSSAMRFQSAQN